MKKGVVSIVIPTRNSAAFLAATLQSIKDQTYKKIETIIVDGKSTDETLPLAKKYKAKVLIYVPKVASGIFDAPHKRNYGMAKGSGEYVYWLDADMVLPPTLIAEAVSLCKSRADAVILHENSFGEGIWANAKNLERLCYWGDDSVESPRFFKKSAWDAIGGFDLSLGAGGDDIDLTIKLKEKKLRIVWAKIIVGHNEGALSINKLLKKRYMYGKEMLSYLKKRPTSWLVSYNPFKPSYFKNWKLFISRPADSIAFVIMRFLEYIAGAMGMIYEMRHRVERQKFNNARNIKDYSDYSFQYYDQTIPPLLVQLLLITPYKTILDLGCGDGALLDALKNRGFLKNKSVYAVDLSPKSIKMVKKIDRSIHAFVDNVEELRTLKKTSIDFLISTTVIEHVDDKGMLRAMHRVLKTNSLAYVTTVYKKWYGWYFYKRNEKWVLDITHLREYTTDKELFGLVDKNKYEIIDSQKTQMWFPVIDFFARKLKFSDRNTFMKYPILRILRMVKVPIIGYYEWEIVLRKR